MPTYLSISTLKDVVPITADSSDASLTLLLNGVEQTIRVILGYDPAYATATEYYSAPPDDRLVLARHPVVSVTSVTVDSAGAWGQLSGGYADTALTAGTDYALELEGVTRSGILRRIGTTWGGQWYRPPTRLSSELRPTPGAIKVVYVAGFTGDCPADVIEAAYGEAAARLLYRTSGVGVVTSDNMDGAGVSVTAMPELRGQNVTPRTVSPQLQMALRAYKRHPIA